MSVDRLYKQRTVIHGIDSEEMVPINADEESKTLAVSLWAWDVNALQYVRVTKDMLDSDYPSFATNRFEWSGGNCIYKGSHADLNASTTDTDWYIHRYDYDGSDNCTMTRFSTGAWDSRTSYWS